MGMHATHHLCLGETQEWQGQVQSCGVSGGGCGRQGLGEEGRRAWVGVPAPCPRRTRPTLVCTRRAGLHVPVGDKHHVEE